MFVERPEDVVRLVRGRDAILRLSGLLTAFGERCGQAGAMHDLGYFLSKPGALPRTPHLLLIAPPGAAMDMPDALLGVVLIFEQKLAGIGLGAYATNDRSGRGNLIARPGDRGWVAGLAAQWLLLRGAHLVLMSYQAEERDLTGEALRASMAELRGRRGIRWAWRERNIPAYLPLPDNLEEALSALGRRTRRNLRYYRRRVELELGAVFVPEVRVSREELLTFNRRCMFTVAPEVAEWRYDSLKELGEPVLAGMRSGTGEWLSLLGGRRYLDRSEILWQMNRAGMDEYSLGTAMRSYFIEHEIAHGAQRLYAEGGTGHSMSHSFAREHVTDLAVKRDSLASKAMQMLARRYIRADNELSRMLSSPELEWREC